MRHQFAPVRLLIALVLLMSLAAPLAVAPAANAQDVPADIDVAAVALTSGDLEDAGFESFGTDRSEMQDAWSFSTLQGHDDWHSAEDVFDAVEDADFVRSHASWFFDPPGDDGMASRVVFSTVILLEDSNGADDLFDFLSDVSDHDLAHPIDNWDDFGDDSAAYLAFSEDGEVRQFNVVVLVDNIIFMIANTEWDSDEFNERAIEDLVDIAIDRIEIGLDAEQPALSNMVLRFDNHYGRRDQYLWRDGFMNRSFNEDDASVEARIEFVEANAQIEHYQMSVQLADFDDTDSEIQLEFWQFVDIYRFEDEDAAEEWFADRADYLVEGEFYADVAFDDAEVGDESFIWVAEGFENQYAHHSYVTIRVGEFVVEHGFTGPEPTIDVVEEIAGDQAACLEDGCLDRIPLPDELDQLIADFSRSLSDADDESATDEGEEDPGNDEEAEDEEEGEFVFPFGDGDDDEDDDDGS